MHTLAVVEWDCCDGSIALAMAPWPGREAVKHWGATHRLPLEVKPRAESTMQIRPKWLKTISGTDFRRKESVGQISSELKFQRKNRV
jgi:hypothetical protein